MRVSLTARRLRFHRPLQQSYGVLHEREIFELELEGVDGVVGRGEAAALEPYDGVPTAIVREALELYRPLLADGDDASGIELMDACRGAADLPQALAAVELALWDRAGRRAGRPVCALLSSVPASAVTVNASIAAGDAAQAARDAARAANAGYGCVKLKVGFDDDEARVGAVREAIGAGVELRLDANGAWSGEQALDQLARLSRFAPSLIEEPVHGVAALRELRQRTDVAIAIDESALQAGAVGSGAADLVCLKISSSGGISALLARASLARAMGSEVYVSTTLDGPVGVAAALHAAAALAPLPACGLATLGLFADCEDPFPVRAGQIQVPTAPGLY